MKERSSCFRQTRNGLEIFVRLTPRSSKDAVEAVEQSPDGRVYLRARVRALPEAGEANKALEKLVAKWLSVPRSDVSVSTGTTARFKTVAVDGEGAGLSARIQEQIAQLGR